jgi:hypothetical protein
MKLLERGNRFLATAIGITSLLLLVKLCFTSYTITDKRFSIMNIIMLAVYAFLYAFRQGNDDE